MPRVKVLLGAGALIMAFGAGYLARKPVTLPVKIAETSEETSKATWATATNHAEKRDESAKSTKTTSKTVYLYRPDGSLSKKLVLGSLLVSESQGQSVALHSESATGASQFSKETTKTVTPVDLDRPWNLSLDVSQTLQDSLGRDFRPSVGVTLSRKILGPLKASGFVRGPVKDFQWSKVQAGASVGLAFTF
jgi:hypothetical protein